MINMGIITLFIMWTSKNIMDEVVNTMEKNMEIYDEDDD